MVSEFVGSIRLFVYIRVHIKQLETDIVLAKLNFTWAELRSPERKRLRASHLVIFDISPFWRRSSLSGLAASSQNEADFDRDEFHHSGFLIRHS